MISQHHSNPPIMKCWIQAIAVTTVLAAFKVAVSFPKAVILASVVWGAARAVARSVVGATAATGAAVAAGSLAAQENLDT